MTQAGQTTEHAEFEGKLYFSADDSLHGKELWVYDPSCLTVTDVNAQDSHAIK